MLSLIYLSAATCSLDAAGLAALGQQSAARNGPLGLTGLLLWNGSGFLQLLEGQAEAVEAVMASIIRDPRHSDVTILRKRVTAQAECPDWAMRAVATPLRTQGSATRFAEILPVTMEMETRIVFVSFAASLHGRVMA